MWGPAVWGRTTVARHSYDSYGQPSPRRPEGEHDWRQGVGTCCHSPHPWQRRWQGSVHHSRAHQNAAVPCCCCCYNIMYLFSRASALSMLSCLHTNAAREPPCYPCTCLTPVLQQLDDQLCLYAAVESRWEAAAAAIQASSATAAAQASPPVKAHVYPRSSQQGAPSPLRSHFPGECSGIWLHYVVSDEEQLHSLNRLFTGFTSCVTKWLAIKHVFAAGVSATERRQRQRRQDGDVSDSGSDSASTCGGSGSSISGNSSGSSRGRTRSPSLALPLDLGRLQEAAKPAQDPPAAEQQPLRTPAAAQPEGSGDAWAGGSSYIPARHGRPAGNAEGYGGGGGGAGARSSPQVDMPALSPALRLCQAALTV